MHEKKRIELFIEKMAYKRACRILVANGLTGYTVLPALAGFGGETEWQRDTDISTSRDMVVVVSIGEEEKVKGALTEIKNLLGAHIGVVSVGSVSVIRDELF
jgi:PII-like signaling protein